MISRGDRPVARLAPLDDRLKAAPLRACAKPVTREEILAWKREGHRY